MSNRSWFFASQGQQQGPYPEAQLRDFIARGTVTAATLVWSQGMAVWQKAGNIPGLLSGHSDPAVEPHAPGSLAGMGDADRGSLSIDFGIWEFIWRSLVFTIGAFLIIPFPWVTAMYCRWIVSCTHVPGRPNLAFTGRTVTILWWYLGVLALAVAAGVAKSLLPDSAPFQSLNIGAGLVEMFLYWLAIGWFIANISSDGQLLGLRFSGSFWAYFGWCVLVFVSLFTIIGWAWVWTAQMRWMCRHVEGTRREVLFTATGWQMLIRTWVLGLASILVIPIPWMMRWYTRWYASHVVLVERPIPANH
jgi:hypothetical protein